MSKPIRIGADCGATRVKGVAWGSKPRLLSFAPYCAETTLENCSQLLSLWGDNISLDSAWVSDPDGHFLLGKAAQNYYGSELGKGERKATKALYQTLGVIGAFARQHGLPNGSSLKVSVLLPFGEYATSESLRNSLVLAAQGFEYCGIKYSFQVEQLAIKPEGAGALLRGMPRGTPLDGRIGSLMVGGRNASYLVMDGGKPDIPSSSTCTLGYNWVVDEVCRWTGHTDQEYVLGRLIDGTDPEVKEKGAIAEKQYLDQLMAWKSSRASVDHLLACGGTAYMLQNELRQRMPTLLWPDELHEEVKQYEPCDHMAFRALDLFGMLKA